MNFRLFLEVIDWKIKGTPLIKLYHGSRKKFPPGFKLVPQVGKGYASWHENIQLERFMEEWRPKGKISRFDSVFLVDDPEMCEYAGGYDDHIYLVEPQGQVDRSDLSWYSQVDLFEPGSVSGIECAKNYWNGVPFEDPYHALWEYRCRSAIVLEEI